MIGMPGQEGEHSVDLLGRHDSRKLMRPGEISEGEAEGRLGAELGVEPIRATNEKREVIRARVAQAAESLRELGARHVFARLVAGDEATGRDAEPGHKTAKRLRLFFFTVLRPARSAFLDFVHIDSAHTKASAKVAGAVQIVASEFPFTAGLQPSDTDEMKTHERRPGGCQPAWCSPGRSRPHIFSRL